MGVSTIYEIIKLPYERTSTNPLQPSPRALFDFFNQETEMQEKDTVALKLLVSCAKRLKEEWASLNIPSTDDFVIVVSDEEESTLKIVK
ncbi:hypothetical protein RCZ04_11000 [Capnocytophaga sp. HP1101]